jgi:hypothetical protein
MASKNKNIDNPKVLVSLTKAQKEDLMRVSERENRSATNMVSTLINNYIQIANNPEAYKQYNNILLDINSKSET